MSQIFHVLDNVTFILNLLKPFKPLLTFCISFPSLCLTSRLVKTLLYNFIRQEKCPPPATHIFEPKDEGGLLYGLASGVASKSQRVHTHFLLSRSSYLLLFIFVCLITLNSPIDYKAWVHTMQEDKSSLILSDFILHKLVNIVVWMWLTSSFIKQYIDILKWYVVIKKQTKDVEKIILILINQVFCFLWSIGLGTTDLYDVLKAAQ